MSLWLCCEARYFWASDELLWSIWHWSAGFSSELRYRKSGYRLNALLQTYFDEVMVMAKKQSTKGQNYAKSGAGSVQWQNVNLSDDDANAIATWLDSDPDLLFEYVRLVSEGYAVGCKPASNGDGFMATIISPVHSETGIAYGLSSYASSPFDALGALLYKFVTLLGGEFSPTTVQSSRRFR